MVFAFWLLFLMWLFSAAVTILVVLIQSGKGGGLSGLVGSGTALGDTIGATGAERTLNRWTTYCASGFIVLTIIIGLMGDKVFQGKTVYDGVGGTESALEEGAAAREPASAAAPADTSASAAAPAGKPVAPAEAESVAPAEAESVAPVEAEPAAAAEAEGAESPDPGGR